MIPGIFIAILICAVASCEGACVAPPKAIARLSAYLSYEGAFRPGNLGKLHFAFATADSESLFHAPSLAPDANARQQMVYVFREGERLLATSCPMDANWTICAQQSFASFSHSKKQESYSAEPTCDLVVNVPKWSPTPRGPRKREVASRVLRELIELTGSTPRAVFVRDFNVNDPELQLLIVGANGDETAQGCHFDADLHPLCIWHLFGQSPVKQIKKEIMARPYKIFPRNGSSQ